MNPETDFNTGYLQCLDDLDEYIHQVSSFNPPPTIEEIKTHFIKLKKEEYPKEDKFKTQSSLV